MLESRNAWQNKWCLLFLHPTLSGIVISSPSISFRSWFWDLNLSRRLTISIFRLRLGHNLLTNRSYCLSHNSSLWVPCILAWPYVIVITFSSLAPFYPLPDYLSFPIFVSSGVHPPI